MRKVSRFLDALSESVKIPLKFIVEHDLNLEDCGFFSVKVYIYVEFAIFVS